jgi:putative PIN family toxin of toxin-antitoxin system
MQRRSHRVIIDTNLWISFLLTNSFDDFDRVIRNYDITLVFSQEFLEEFLEVARRPKFRKYFPLEQLYSLVTEIRSIADFIEVNSIVSICRDSKDNFLLALAKDGRATHLITGDQDLLILEKFGRTKIVNMSSFLNLYSEK